MSRNPKMIEFITEIANGKKNIHLNDEMYFSKLNVLFSLTSDFKKEILNSPVIKDNNNAFSAENSYPKTLVNGRVSRNKLVTPIIMRYMAK